MSYNLSYNLCSLQHRGSSKGSIKSFQTSFILMVFRSFFQTLMYVSSSEIDVRNVKLQAAQALAVQDDAESMAATTAFRASSLGGQASIPRSPSLPASHVRGPFMEFGRVRIRLWFVCRAGREIPCGLMTTDENWKYKWSGCSIEGDCCGHNPHVYRQKWNMIMQISAMDKEFLTTLDPDHWLFDIWTESYICEQAEATIYSATEVFGEIRQAEKFNFDQVFRQADKDKVQRRVNLEKTWCLRRNVNLPNWSYELLYGVVKYCR